MRKSVKLNTRLKLNLHTKKREILNAKADIKKKKKKKT